MEVMRDNPASNVLPPKLHEADVLDAITQSGYPLQTLVGERLAPRFSITEEWTYLDDDTQQRRSIDIFAERPMFDANERKRVRISPYLNLLIECKKSELPFVFFLSSFKPKKGVTNYPLLAGLNRNLVTLRTNDDPSLHTMPLSMVLGLATHPFLTSQPAYCMPFSKCVRKGKSIELSGEEPFNGLILPLIKAMCHFQRTEEPPSTAIYFDFRLTFGIGVLDAPMIGARTTEGSCKLSLVPWVRVLRHAGESKPHEKYPRDWFGIDIVHRDFLGTYIEKLLLPFAQQFVDVALKHHEVVASGKGFARELVTHFWDIEHRLKPTKSVRVFDRA